VLSPVGYRDCVASCDLNAHKKTPVAVFFDPNFTTEYRRMVINIRHSTILFILFMDTFLIGFL
jgi:hypothetical protein